MYHVLALLSYGFFSNCLKVDLVFALCPLAWWRQQQVLSVTLEGAHNSVEGYLHWGRVLSSVVL